MDTSAYVSIRSCLPDQLFDSLCLRVTNAKTLLILPMKNLEWAQAFREIRPNRDLFCTHGPLKDYYPSNDRSNEQQSSQKI